MNELADDGPPSKKTNGDRVAALLMGFVMRHNLGVATTPGRKQFSDASGPGARTHRLRRGVGPDFPADERTLICLSALGPILARLPLGFLTLFRSLLLLALVLVFFAAFVAH